MKYLPTKVLGAGAVVVLALSFTFSHLSVPKAQAATPPNEFFGPGMRGLMTLEQKLAALEATVSSFAESFTSVRVTTQELCISDQTGAQTCLTKSQLDALLAAPSSDSQDSSTSGVQISEPTVPISGVSSSTPPTITVNGDNPAIIQVGDSYADLGATVSDTGPGQAGDTDLGITTFLNGTLVSTIDIDTSQVATDTIDYVGTDIDGLTATSTRTVIIEPVTEATSTANRSTFANHSSTTSVLLSF